MISPVRVWFLGRTSSIRTDYKELRETIPVRRFGLEFRCIDMVLGGDRSSAVTGDELRRGGVV